MVSPASEEGRSPQGVGDSTKLLRRREQVRRPKRVDPRKGLETNNNATTSSTNATRPKRVDPRKGLETPKVVNPLFCSSSQSEEGRSPQGVGDKTISATISKSVKNEKSEEGRSPQGVGDERRH